MELIKFKLLSRQKAGLLESTSPGITRRGACLTSIH